MFTCSSNGGRLGGSAATVAVTRLSSSPAGAGQVRLGWLRRAEMTRLARRSSGRATTPSRSTSLRSADQPPSAADPCR